MATKAALSGDSGTSAFLSLLGILVLSVVNNALMKKIVALREGDYSDAVFDCSSSRSVLRGGTLHGRMLLVGLRHKCRHCPASTFGGNTRSSPIILLLFLLDLQPERLFKLAFTDGCCPLTKPCPFVFINPFHNRFWSCYHTFFRCKVSM